MGFELQTLFRWQAARMFGVVNTTTFFRKVNGPIPIRTVTSSVILRTSLPSEDLHFTLYRV